SSQAPRTLADKFLRLNWGVITLLCMIAVIGVAMHFSDSSGQWTDMPLTHGVRFSVIMLIVIVAARLAEWRLWIAVAYPRSLASLILLVLVDVKGATHMGATRWLELGPLSLQPSELMKIGIVLALARYYHQLDPRRTGTLLWSIPPLLMIGAPVALVMK